MSAPSHDPEERWRRTVQQRGRPLKLKVGRLLREFGYSELEPDIGETVQARLAQVGVTVRPSLIDADSGDVITLDLVRAEAEPAAAAPPPDEGPALSELPFAGTRESPPPGSEPRFAPRTEPRFSPRGASRPAQPASTSPAPAGQIEHSPLVRAAVEAERRVRSAYDEAAAAAEERIARLERELAVERDAIARTRDERDQLEERMHVERRQAAARLQALAAAERTALRLLEAERAQLTDRAQMEFGSEPTEAEIAHDEQPRSRSRGPSQAAGQATFAEAVDEPSRDEIDDVEPFGDLVDEHPPQPVTAPEDWEVAELELEPEPTPSRRPGLPRSGRARRTPRATFRPAPDWTPPQPRAPGRRTALIALVPLALLGLAALGYVLGHGDEPSAAPSATALAQRASAGGLELRYPEGWVRRGDAPRIVGVRFETPLALSASETSDAVIVAGLVKDAVGSDLLPSSLRSRLPESTPPAEPVLLGDVQALRYAALAPQGASAPLTLFAVPTTDGSVIVACRGSAGGGDFLDVCERAAATLRLEGLASERLDGRRALALGPSTAYGRRVAAAISAIEVAQTIEGERLRKATSADAQATIADAVAKTFTSAADELGSGPVSARDREGHAGLLRAIRAGAGAYGRLSAAAGAGRGEDYASASQDVQAADARVRKAITALGSLGYT